MTVRAILFDLDGTLLDIDLAAFLDRYFEALGSVILELTGADTADAGLRALMQATRAMSLPHEGRTNREVFAEDFLRLSGIDIDLETATFEAFYEDVFPALGRGTRAAPGARAAVDAALRAGLKVVVATNPIFPLRAIEHRIAWAGLRDVDFDLTTSFEIMESTKPHAAYYHQIANILDVDPRDALMVGDDPVLDLAAADAGMKTYHVAQGHAAADFRGDLRELADLIPRLASSG